ncbi:MAG: hypothetical protein HRU09_07930 [Oligoflexales bacterium]|nr:hypothetical protein [Oligoflexales bacterium]
MLNKKGYRIVAKYFINTCLLTLLIAIHINFYEKNLVHALRPFAKLVDVIRHPYHLTNQGYLKPDYGLEFGVSEKVLDTAELIGKWNKPKLALYGKMTASDVRGPLYHIAWPILLLSGNTANERFAAGGVLAGPKKRFPECEIIEFNLHASLHRCERK